MSGKVLIDDMSPSAKKMHHIMVTNGKSSYTQNELLSLLKFENINELMENAQVLLNKGLLKILESDGDGDSKEKQILFAAISEQEAKKVSNMTADEAIVYSHVEAAGREGIWTKTIKAKTNLHQHIVLRCLKSLESQSYIKSVKSVKHPTRKIYMLYHLTPSIDVTGGPWFTDSELDTDFIDSLLIVIWKFVAQKTFPKCFKKRGLIPNGLKQYSYSSQLLSNMGTLLPTLNDVNEFIISSGITTVELTLSDVKSLCDVLEFDEKIENTGGSYKATWQSVLEAGGGKIEGEDLFAPLDDEIFNVNDNYRVMDTLVADNGESNGNNNNTESRVYLDSWITL
ncbi:34-kDa subunit of RNA polymerase III (C) [Pichia californica]|uniref:DNA-directed RNA polymerase III subunit RPC6 n=1 Tax=Pichia californica TaxID=460514 RepID=A0A9P6WQK8_9ASCO|nr:34-kDa subunit of RNA polymerase III (C) [[Candida] californica]